MDARVIALVGAESTGKTTLALGLGEALRAPGRRVAVVGEYLREFCDRQRRTPRADEQAHIAAEQSRRIATAAASHDLVIADTTALMIAVYSDQVFGDTSLYAQALRAHSCCALTLLTALDLPWLADGHQRDGPQVRAPVDRKLRAALAGHAGPLAVVSGTGERRLAQALAAVRRVAATPARAESVTRWHGICERCGDPACERHRLPPL